MNEKELYKKYVNAGDVVYDIGAFVGEMTKMFLDLSVKNVICFEPAIKNFNILKNNFQSNPKVKCFNVALNDLSYKCRTRFKDCRTDDEEQDIEYVILKKFIENNEIPLPDFIKIDAEGMESIILTTFDFLFEDKRPTLFIEIHAQKKGSTNQTYSGNPHYKWPDEGGIDFNKFKKLNYIAIDFNNTKYDLDKDWNPEPQSHKHMILAPIEKIH